MDFTSYTGGECCVPHDGITSFLSLAEDLNVDGLSEKAKQSSETKKPSPQENNNMNLDEVCKLKDNNDKETCDDTIPDEVMLLANISEEIGPEGKMFECDLCSKILKREDILLSHLLSKLFPGMFSHKCQRGRTNLDNRKSLLNLSRYCGNR